MRTALTFCPLHECELERFLAFSSSRSLYDKVVVMALPSRMGVAKAATERHPELQCVIQEYPLTLEYPDYYDPDRAGELPFGLAKRFGSPSSGVVLVSGAAVPFPIMKTVFAPPVKPHYNCFRILKRLGVEETYSFTLNSLERLRIPFLLDDFVGVHKGRRCFVVGNGPSLKSLDMSLLKDEITLGSNKVYLGFKDWGFNFTYWGIIDDRQIEQYPDEWENKLPKDIVKFFPFEYLKALNLENGCPLNTYHTNYAPYPHNFIDPKRPKEDFTAKYMFSEKPDVSYLGPTVTYTLLQVAVVMGCNPIYLIGTDHRFNITSEDRKRGYWTSEKGDNHFHSGYSHGKRFNLPEDEKAEAFFNYAAKYCPSLGVTVLNATPGSALKSFPMADFNSLFKDSGSIGACGSAASGNGSQAATWPEAHPCAPLRAPTVDKLNERDNRMKKATILLCSPDMNSEITRRCLDSLNKCTDPKLYKLVISDNKWDAKFSHPHEMNKCLATLDTPFMVSLDDDVVLSPGWLEALLEAAEADPSLGCVGCVHTFADGTINHSGGTLYYASGSLRTKQAVSPITQIEYTTYANSSCVLFRKTSLLFDETYAKYRFELDYCFRLWESGFRIAIVPHKIQHLVSQQMLQKHDQMQDKLKEANQLDEVVFSRKWYASGRLDALYREIRGSLTHPDLNHAVLSTHVKQVNSGAPGLTVDLLLPSFVREKIKGLKAAGHGRIVIFGAGKHTAWLASLLGKEAEDLNIKAILDDNSDGKTSFFGLRPTAAMAFKPKPSDIIILSTDCWQKEMAERCRKLYGAKVKLLDLYEGLPQGPYNKAV